MIDHPYISVRLYGDLDQDIAKKWFHTVLANSPSGILVADEISPGSKPTQFYCKKNKSTTQYIVVLSRNLTADEAAAIAKKWSDEFETDDFEIDWSQNTQIDTKTSQIKEDLLKAVALEATKKMHNQWTNEKISEGWRYAQRYNKVNKTNPLLTSWENLSEKYKLVEYKRFTKLLEVLDEMGMTITKKV